MMWMYLVVLILTSTFCCTQAGSIGEERSALVCEGGKQKIRCTHQKIEIISAVYGRTDRSVCQWGLDWMVAWAWNVNCRAPNTFDIVKKECDTLSECDLHANNAEFGDPCFATKKYLTVKYRCTGRITPGDTRRARVCENHKISLECPEKRNIDIVWANFGRLKGGHICGDGFFGVFSWNQACHHQEKSKQIAKKTCQDTEQCTLDATVETFGDACFGTTKYLEVRYRCCPKKGGCD
ncbi:L-rhamnose-binding lectin CSL1-like [Stylophora pistillata]|uniref:Rhamnose-binding lectin n=1 Tax=Stylophora pistillata TaxID=50429 RepID=A0A2B4SPW0_STYPI|nr:L-rhamnose-binding lectin CSL1-like [Stylophora pistillata]XP_022780200.1 L-rhamnose-binding lectin CSL1-like [Stylophora pistillata]XP_022780201.1 L-rhamnose-binding lectin CSL1-like [Stylophora pistillata]PFX31951.1 Rhamnose-binding lectin [Stylophora pistillata]